MPGQDFLDLLNSEESTPATPGDDFNELMNSDSTGIDTSKIKIQSNDYEEKLTEPQLDQIEQQNSPGIVDGTIQAAQGGYKELKGIYHTLSKTEEYLHPILKSYMKAALIPSIPNYVERQNQTHKLASDIKTVIPELVKASPEIASSLIQDLASSFGVENNSQTGQLRVDPDVALNKLREAPLSTLADWTIAGAVFKKAVKLGEIATKFASMSEAEKAANRVGDTGSFVSNFDPKTIRKETESDKDFLRNMLSKMDENTKEAQYSRELDKVTKSDTPTIKDQLIDNRKSFLSIPKKDLDNPEFARKVGNRFKQNLDIFTSAERGRLKASLAPISGNKVDSELLFSKIYNDLIDSYLIGNENAGKAGPYSEKIKSGFKGSMVENVLTGFGGDITVGELNENRKRLDQAINFKDPKQSDKALMIIRSNIDNYIKDLKGAEQYKEESAKVADRLQLFRDKQRKIESPGGGETFAKTFFKTREDLDGLKSVLKSSDVPLAHSLRADLDVLDSWHTWNRMWAQNTKVVPDFYMGYPMTAGMKAINIVAQPVAKSLVRSEVAYPKAVNAAKIAVPSFVDIRNTARANRASESLDTSQY